MPRKKPKQVDADEQAIWEEAMRLAQAQGRAWLKAHPEQRAHFEATFDRWWAKTVPPGGDLQQKREEHVLNSAVGAWFMERQKMKTGKVTKKMVTEAFGHEPPPGWDDLLPR